MLKPLLTSLLIIFAVIPGFSRDNEPQYIRIHPYKVKINDSLCYQVKKGYSRRDPAAWEPFCGVLDNFYFWEGYEYTVYVKKYDPEADSMFVTKTIASSDVREDVFQEKLLDHLMKQKAKSSSATNHRLPSGEPQYMKVYPYKIRVNDSLCYEVGPGYREEDEGTLLKEPFCGVFKNFNYEEGRMYTLSVEKYDPQADTLFVLSAASYPGVSVSKEALARKAVQLKKKSAPRGEIMKVHQCQILVNDSLCYQIRQRNTAPWEPFCGVLYPFYFTEGHEHLLAVKEYNPHADTIYVIKGIGRDGSDHRVYNKRQKSSIKSNCEECERMRKKMRADAIRASSASRKRKR
ncbi:MAG: hypothetical protein J6T67_04215 [Paludibacteraceae bacterium]|nr:hypothetical protein [Paludibacteraceae bacterium]